MAKPFTMSFGLEPKEYISLILPRFEEIVKFWVD